MFLVRKGNPKGIHDWDDLVKPEVQVITPHPKTSGGARWNYLAAWGYACSGNWATSKKLARPEAGRGGGARPRRRPRTFVAELYQPCAGARHRGPRRDVDLRPRGMGDVLLAWENEALQETQGAGGRQIRDRRAQRQHPGRAAGGRGRQGGRSAGHAGVAEAYLKYLYSPEGQTIAAKNFYRPADRKVVPKEYLKAFTDLKLFTVDEVFGGWQQGPEDAFQRRRAVRPDLSSSKWSGQAVTTVPESRSDATSQHRRNRACCPASA